MGRGVLQCFHLIPGARDDLPGPHDHCPHRHFRFGIRLPGLTQGLAHVKVVGLQIDQDGLRGWRCRKFIRLDHGHGCPAPAPQSRGKSAKSNSVSPCITSTNGMSGKISRRAAGLEMLALSRSSCG